MHLCRWRIVFVRAHPILWLKCAGIFQFGKEVGPKPCDHDGAGATCDEAREALLTAWARHRAHVVSQQPALGPTLPEARQMQQHFKIRYREYTRGAGYREDERLV